MEDILSLLNETRTKNLDKLASKSFRDLYEDFPVELTRIFYKGIEETGIEVGQEKKKETINDVARENLFFNYNKVFDLPINKGFDIKISSEKNKITVAIRTWSNNYYLPESTLRFNKKEPVKDIINKIQEYIKDNKVEGSYKESERNKIKEKYGSISNLPKEIKSIKRLANKNLYNFSAGIEDTLYSIIFTFNTNDILSSVEAKLPTDKVYQLQEIRYSFQIDLLQKIVNFAINKIEAINHNIVNLIANKSKLKLTISKKQEDKIFGNDDQRIGNLHKENKEKLKNISSLYTDTKELELSGFKHKIINLVFEGDYEI